MSDAIKFIQQKGLDAAKELVNFGTGFVSVEDGLSFHTDQLISLIQSHELVEMLGGLNKVKRLLAQAPKKASHWGNLNKSYYSYDDFFGQWKQYWDIQNAPVWQTVVSMQFEGELISLRTLKQAIKDIEACQGVAQ